MYIARGAAPGLLSGGALHEHSAGGEGTRWCEALTTPTKRQRQERCREGIARRGHGSLDKQFTDIQRRNPL